LFGDQNKFMIKVINKENNIECLFEVEKHKVRMALNCIATDLFLQHSFFLIKDNEKIPLTKEYILTDEIGFRGSFKSKYKCIEILEKELNVEELNYYITFLQALIADCKEIHFYPSKENLREKFVFIY